MIPKDEIAAVLDDFAKKVIQQARRNLTIFSGNKTRALYNSFDRDVEIFTDSVQVAIQSKEYNDYGIFQDRGVRGVERGTSLDGFRYKRKGGANSLKGMPPPNAFITDKINRFVADEGRRFATAVTVFKFGIQPTKFFTKPFETAFLKVSGELEDAYGESIEIYLTGKFNDG